MGLEFVTQFVQSILGCAAIVGVGVVRLCVGHVVGGGRHGVVGTTGGAPRALMGFVARSAVVAAA